MRFSIFHNVGAPGRLHEVADVLDEIRDVATYADTAGYHSIWYTEHHFGHEGFELIPNPVLMGVDIAARTSRIRIGQAANIVTFWNPMRLAEDIAMLDQLSRGRAEVAVGRGLYGREAMNLNPMADPRDQEQNRALFEETLEVLRKSWSGGFFSHDGDLHTYPAPGISWNHPLSPPSPEFVGEDGTLNRMQVVPQSFQRPHPPLSQVIDTPRSIAGAARSGMKGIFWMPPISELKGRFELYRDTLSETTGVDAALGTGLSLVRDVYVADTMEQARADFEEALMTSYRWICHWRGMNNLREVDEDITGRELDFDFLAERNLLVGTPDFVAEKVHELQQELNLQDLLLWTTHPGLEHGKAMRSFELFAEKVMPQFAGDPRMSGAIRRIVTVVDESVHELGAPVRTPVRRAAAVAVVANPWLGRGVLDDLSPEVAELAPGLAHALSDRLLAALGGADRVEAFGKAAIVGLDGETEHAGALIHTPFFGDVLRHRTEGESIIVFSDQRAAAGTSLTVPMWHKDHAATRSHYQTVTVRVPDGPRPGEIAVVAAASDGPRPNARIGDRRTDAALAAHLLDRRNGRSAPTPNQMEHVS